MQTTNLNIGQKVLLYCKNDPLAPKALKELDGRLFRISAVFNPCIGVGYKTKRGRYYNLEYCNTKQGVPWTIDPDWLVPVGGVEE